MVTWIQSKNDIMEYSMGFELNYTLYEEGWLLDSITPIEKDKWQYYATKTPSIEEVDEVIKERYPNAKSYQFNNIECDETNKAQIVNPNTINNIVNFDFLLLFIFVVLSLIF